MGIAPAVTLLRHDSNKRLVVIANVKDGRKDEKEAAERSGGVTKIIGVSEKVVKVMAGSAKCFLQRKDLGKVIHEFLPEPPKAEF